MGNKVKKRLYISKEGKRVEYYDMFEDIIESKAEEKAREIIELICDSSIDFIERALYEIKFSSFGLDNDDMSIDEQRLYFYEWIKSDVECEENYLFEEYDDDYREDVKCKIDFVRERLSDFIQRERVRVIENGLKKRDVVIGKRTIKMTSLLDSYFYCYSQRYFFKEVESIINDFFDGLCFSIYDFLEQFNEIIRDRIIEAYSYFEKWGNYRPQETTAANLKEYYEVLPRFELSAIYKAAERVEQEKANETNAPKEIKTDTLDYSKGKITQSKCFGYNYSREQLDGVFNVLVERGMVEETEKDNFYKVFTSRNYDELCVKIKWLDYYTYFPVLIRVLADNAMSIENKNIWALSERYFIKADGSEWKDLRNVASKVFGLDGNGGSRFQQLFKNEILEAIKKPL